MKKTEEYYQALDICNNAKDYHNIDVMVAKTYVRAYDEAINYSCCKPKGTDKIMKTQLWNSKPFKDKQKKLRKHRRLVNLKNKIILKWLDFKDNFICLQRYVYK